MQGMYNTFYDVSKMSLWADKGDKERAPRLVLSFRDGNPRFVVYTGESMVNHSGATVPVIINFPCSHVIMYTVLDAIDRVANAEPGYKEAISSKAPLYENGERTNRQRVVSTFNVGKTKDGIIAIVIKEEKKPEVVFAFRKNEWHDHTVGNQEEVDEASLSKRYALAYTFLVKNSLSLALLQYTEDAFANSEYKPKVIEPFKPNNFGNKKGGSGKTAYGSKGTEKVTTDFDSFDSDVPF